MKRSNVNEVVIALDRLGGAILEVSRLMMVHANELEPAKPEPAKPEPAKPEPAKPEPAKPEPAKPEPAKPEPAKPEPAEPAFTLADVKEATIAAAKKDRAKVMELLDLFSVKRASDLPESAWKSYIESVRAI